MLSPKQQLVLAHLRKTWSVGQWFNGLHGDNDIPRIGPTLCALFRRGLLKRRTRSINSLVTASLYEFCLTEK